MFSDPVGVPYALHQSKLRSSSATHRCPTHLALHQHGNISDISTPARGKVIRLIYFPGLYGYASILFYYCLPPIPTSTEHFPYSHSLCSQKTPARPERHRHRNVQRRRAPRPPGPGIHRRDRLRRRPLQPPRPIGPLPPPPRGGRSPPCSAIPAPQCRPCSWRRAPCGLDGLARLREAVEAVGGQASAAA